MAGSVQPLGAPNQPFGYGEGNAPAGMVIKTIGDLAGQIIENRRKAFGDAAKRENDNLDFAWRTQVQHEYNKQLMEHETAQHRERTITDTAAHIYNSRQQANINLSLLRRVQKAGGVQSFQHGDGTFSAQLTPPKAPSKPRTTAPKIDSTKTTTPVGGTAKPAATKPTTAKTPATKPSAAKPTAKTASRTTNKPASTTKAPATKVPAAEKPTPRAPRTRTPKP